MTRTTIVLMATACLLVGCGANAAEVYVSPDGSDSNPGTRQKPFATLERARDFIRAQKPAAPLPGGGVTVWLQGGTYALRKPFELTAEDSGTADAPIVYRARPGAEVRLTGGRRVTGWTPVTGSAVPARMGEAARRQVRQADLPALNIADLGEVVGGNRLELFFQDKPMTLARWPNQEYARIADVVGGAPFEVHGRRGDRTGKFTYSGDRPERWTGEKDPWVHGYWMWEWAEQRQQVGAVDTQERTIAIKPPYHAYGYRKGQPFYAFNMLSELDAPGEWYLDRSSGLLYFWPPAPLDQGAAFVSVTPTLVTMTGAAQVTLRGIVLEACRGTAIVVSNGTGVMISGCTIRNTGDWAVRMSGVDSGVRGCDIYATGGGGISLAGGSRKTLTAGRLEADNNHIHDYSRWARVYQPGIILNGVGNRATHNLIHDAPHLGIMFHGNDHLIEYNELHHLCLETSDAAAIYAGRDITVLGNQIRHNYFHDLGSAGEKLALVAGVYLDDNLGGTEIYGNIFVGTTWAAVNVNGGRDNRIENNLFLRCRHAVRAGNGNPDFFKGKPGYETVLKRLQEVPYAAPPWSERYPQLAARMGEPEPWLAINNWVVRNVCVDCPPAGLSGQPANEHVEPTKASPWQMNTDLYHIQSNWVSDGEPGHKTQVSQDPDRPEDAGFALRANSPALEIGFQRIPFEQIGCYQNPLRASWPLVRKP